MVENIAELWLATEKSLKDTYENFAEMWLAAKLTIAKQQTKQVLMQNE